MKNLSWTWPFVFLIFMFLAMAVTSFAQTPPRITTDELKSILGKADLIVVDVRSAPDWKATQAKIQGAIREDPAEVLSWMEKYPKDKTLVFYCD